MILDIVILYCECLIFTWTVSTCRKMEQNVSRGSRMLSKPHVVQTNNTASKHHAGHHYLYCNYIPAITIHCSTTVPDMFMESYRILQLALTNFNIQHIDSSYSKCWYQIRNAPSHLAVLYTVLRLGEAIPVQFTNLDVSHRPCSIAMLNPVETMPPSRS